MSLTFEHIQGAQERLKPYLSPTPLEPSPDLGEEIYLKLENTNQTHSFKIRGALNAILSLSPDAKARGIVTVSSGNHAQGVSYAAHLTETNALILMPKHTPQKKIKGAQRWGAEVMLYGNNYDETEAEGRRLEREEGMIFISPYNDAAVIAGAGTVGLEIAHQLPTVERVVVCVSGGGLIGGIGTALKHINPDIEVIGVNAESAPAMYNHFHHTHKPEVWETLAEALSGDIEKGSITLGIADQVIDNMLCVTEEQIASAMHFMLETQGWLVEGGGCVGVATILHGLLPKDGKPTAVIVSGGNIDIKNIKKVLGCAP